MKSYHGSEPTGGASTASKTRLSCDFSLPNNTLKIKTHVSNVQRLLDTHCPVPLALKRKLSRARRQSRLLALEFLASHREEQSTCSLAARLLRYSSTKKQTPHLPSRLASLACLLTEHDNAFLLRRVREITRATTCLLLSLIPAACSPPPFRQKTLKKQGSYKRSAPLLAKMAHAFSNHKKKKGWVENKKMSCLGQKKGMIACVWPLSSDTLVRTSPFARCLASSSAFLVAATRSLSASWRALFSASCFCLASCSALLAASARSFLAFSRALILASRACWSCSRARRACE